MKFNQECMLDILAVIEESIKVILKSSMHRVDNEYDLQRINSDSILSNEILASKYTAEEIFYSLLQLHNTECLYAKVVSKSNVPNKWDI